MIVTLTHNNSRYSANLQQGIDCSLHITENNPVQAFGLPLASFTPFRFGSLVLSVEEGGPVRCDIVQLAPHGNGTHTECCGHVLGKGYNVCDALTQPMMIATLITVPLTTLPNGDVVVHPSHLEQLLPSTKTPALILRTSPNSESKVHAVYSGNNPPYILPEAMQIIDTWNPSHLLVDMPSVDREEDSGALLSHRIFWRIPHDIQVHKTITELVYINNSVADGLFLLCHNMAAFNGDAAPSRPMIYTLTEEQS